MKRFILMAAGFFAGFNALSQGSIRDSSLTIVHVRISYAGCLPAGDLANRFGWNSLLAGNADVKLKSNWIFGLGYNFIFGKKIRENVMSNLINSEGQIIDANGSYSTVLSFERGFTGELYMGYLIPRFGPNPNSGILFTLGGGYMQHKIKIEHRDNPIPQLEGDYLKGYDRLTGGPMAHFFMGYQYLSNTRLWNFFGGFDLFSGFTMNRRSYNFNTMETDRTQRLDLMYGLRVGWIFPLYSRATREVYY